MAKLHIIAGSVYGGAQHAADIVAAELQADGIDCEVFSDPQVNDFTSADALLVVTSTTGQGDVPPNLELVFSDLRDEFPMLNAKPFAVAALGDSSYGDSFCGGGRQFFTLLEELQGNPVADMLEVDAIEVFEPEVEVLEFVNQVRPRLLG